MQWVVLKEKCGKFIQDLTGPLCKLLHVGLCFCSFKFVQFRFFSILGTGPFVSLRFESHFPPGRVFRFVLITVLRNRNNLKYLGLLLFLFHQNSCFELCPTRRFTSECISVWVSVRFHLFVRFVSFRFVSFWFVSFRFVYGLGPGE